MDGVGAALRVVDASPSPDASKGDGVADRADYQGSRLGTSAPMRQTIA